jgi:CubicO group peptidase (beta-lactamase class C family)
MDSEGLADMLEALLASREDYRPHQVLVVRNGQLVLDVAFFPFSRGLPHNIASIGKMVTATLIGMAIDEGYIASVDEPVLGFFPDRVIANRDVRKEAMTIAHLLAHRSGIDYQSDQYAEMLASPDWIQWILDLPMVSDPGGEYSYSNANFHLAAWVLVQATGMTPLEFARRHLFWPLRSANPIWDVDPQGVHWGFGGEFLLPSDLAKLGIVYLNGGAWHGRQVVSPEWVGLATTGYPGPHPPGWSPEWSMGFGWANNSGLNMLDTAGSGGQSMRVLLDDDVVVVAVAGGGPAYDSCGRNSAVIDDLLYNYLRTAIVSSSPLAPNPQGVARLTALVETASLPFDGPPQPVPTLPAIAETISGVVFEMDANPVQVDWFSLSFPPGNEAMIEIGGIEVVSLRIGLDDMFRVSPGEHGLPFAAKGRWVDDTRFAMLYDQVAQWRLLDLEFLFEGSDVTITLQDIACDDQPLTLTGHSQQQQ